MMIEVDVFLVLYNSAGELPALLRSLRRQKGVRLHLHVFDNASKDDGAARVREAFPTARITISRQNLGFAPAMNALYEQSRAPFACLVNPDIDMEPDCLAQLVSALSQSTASVAQPLLSQWTQPALVDSLGITMRPDGRHLDLARDEPVLWYLTQPLQVFGATGALMMLHRARIEPVVLAFGSLFDERFHSYREDADLAWRLRACGHECLMTPLARARHRRHVLPERRSSLPAFINYHGVKNRFLLRQNNWSLDLLAGTLVPSLLRDIAVVGYVIFKERSSLGALRDALLALPESLKRRRRLRAMRTKRLSHWFSFKPVMSIASQREDDSSRKGGME